MFSLRAELTTLDNILKVAFFVKICNLPDSIATVSLFSVSDGKVQITTMILSDRSLVYNLCLLTLASKQRIRKRGCGQYKEN